MTTTEDKFEPPKIKPLSKDGHYQGLTCEYETQAGRECGKQAKFRFQSRSPWTMRWVPVLACTEEHALAKAEALWGIGYDFK